MSLVKILFGEDKSKDFQKTIPPISTKQLIIRSSKIIGASVLSIVIGFIVVGILTVLNFIEPLTEGSEETTIINFFIAGCTFLTAMLYFTKKYFYKDWSQIKKFYTSLPAKTVIKHVFILIRIEILVGVIGTMIMYLLDPKTIAIDLQAWNKEEEDLKIGDIIYLLLPLLFFYTGFVEELFARGGLFRILRFRYSTFSAVMISAIIFTLMHFWNSLPTIFIMTLHSMLFAWYVQYKNNLMTVSIVHSLHDLLIVGITSHVGLLIANMILNS